ncbi:MAG: capsid cement protein [Candidatus Heimdallarchaeota archaeon]
MVLSGAYTVDLGPDGGNPITYTVADGTHISGGNLLLLQDPRTAINSSDSSPGAAIVNRGAGVACFDKEANDGSTTISCYTTGIFDIKCTNAVNAGDFVMISGANTVAPIPDIPTASGGAIFGRALEDGSADEVINVQLLLG